MNINNLKREWLTIPNILSLFRLMLIPVYVVLYLSARNYTDHFLAATILAVSCLTDLIDGKIARHFNMTSTVGKILDPLADKATQFTLILCLAFRYSVLMYLIIVFFIKECFQLIAGIINWRKGIILKKALLSGKICTTILFISLIVMVLIPYDRLPERTVAIITVVDLVFLAVAFLDYLCTYLFIQKRFEKLPKAQ